MIQSHGLEEKEKSTTALERALIGSVIGGDVLPSNLGMIAREFDDPLCRRIFEICLRMEDKHTGIDYAGVCMTDETLDPQAVHGIWEERCISPVLIGRNVNMLREAALMKAYRAELQRALCAQGEAGEQIGGLQKRLEALLRASAEQERTGASMLELIVRVLDEIEKPQTAPEPVASGIEKLDECLCGGFRAGDLAVVAALTSVGKSAMLAFMMRNAAETGKHVLLVSCEMSDMQNAERYIAAISGIPMQDIIARKALTDEQNRMLCDGMERYHPENIRVISSGTQTPESIRRAAVQMKNSVGLDLIVVDYLQRLCIARTGANRADEVGSIAASLKSMAVDLNVPVLTAAQFNREAARGRSEARGQEDAGVPALHQLRDSSQIEDEANAVIVLDEPWRAAGNIRDINAHVVKNRSGGLKSVRLRFDGETMRYAQA